MSSSPLLLILLILLFSPLITNAHKCSQSFADEIRKNLNSTGVQNCRKKTQGAEFAWSFDKASRRLDIAFAAKLRHETGWLAWGLNPMGPHMVGTQALVGIRRRDGSLEKYTYNVSAPTKTQRCPLVPEEIGLKMSRFEFFYMEALEYYVILATILLTDEFNPSSTNVVWQIGEGVAGNQLLMHPRSLQSFDSTAVLDLQSTQLITHAHKRRYLRTAHGVVNMVGWGTLLPSGVIVARYTRIFPKPCRWWYDVHVSCQSAGYIIGSGGWALGIWLGKTSTYYKFNIHNTLGFIIFIFTSIQMLAWRLRPIPSDEYRAFWNMYHHFLGYAILALISLNIFLGIKILEPDHVWKWAYIGVLGGLGMLVLAFELFGWIHFLVKKTHPD
ncbi:hypothetical protein C2S52_013333, partial [Perilla frutescens var. hirtella]